MLIFLISWSISKIGNDVKPKDKFNGIHYFIFVFHVRSMLYASSFSNYKFHTNYIIERVEHEHLISLEIKVKFIPHIAEHGTAQHTLYIYKYYVSQIWSFLCKNQIKYVQSLFMADTHTYTYIQLMSNKQYRCTMHR